MSGDSRRGDGMPPPPPHIHDRTKLMAIFTSIYLITLDEQRNLVDLFD